MRVVKALDAGAMFEMARRPIDPDETSDEVERDLARLGAGAARRGASGRLLRDARPRRRRTTSRPPTRRSSRRQKERSTGRCRPSVFTTWCGGCIRGRSCRRARRRAACLVHRTALDAGRQSRCARHDRARRSRRGWKSSRATARVARACSTIQPEGKRAMSAREFLAGRHVSPGIEGRARGSTADADGSGSRRPRGRLSGARAVRRGRADLPTALARARTRLPDERDRALAGEIVAGTLRWQGSARPPHRARSAAARSRGSIPRCSTSCALSVFQLLHLDRVPAAAVVDDAVDLTRAGRQDERRRFVNAVLRRVSRERHQLPLPPRPAGDDDRGAALDYLGDHAFASALAGRRGGWTATASTATEGWLRVQQRPRAADAPRQHAAHRASCAQRVADANTASSVDPGRFAPDASGRARRQSPADAARRHRTRSSSRTRRRSSCVARRCRARASVSSTRAPLPAARRPRWPRPCGDRGLIVATRRPRPARRAARARRCASRAPGRVQDRSGRRAPRCRSPTSSIACWSTLRARASARSGAIPTSGGAGPKPTCRSRGGAAAAADGQRRARSARRPPGLRDLLERARGERGRGRGVSDRSAGFRRGPPRNICLRGMQPLVNRRPATCERCPFRDGLEAFFARASWSGPIDRVVRLIRGLTANLRTI